MKAYEREGQGNSNLDNGTMSEARRWHAENISKEEQSKGRPGIDKNVWSRFDDDGWGIYNVQPPKPADKDDK